MVAWKSRGRLTLAPALALSLLCGLTAAVASQKPAAALDKPVEWVGTIKVKTWQSNTTDGSSAEYWHETTYTLAPDATFTNEATWSGTVHYSVKSYSTSEPCPGLQDWTFYDGTSSGAGVELDVTYSAPLGGYSLATGITFVPVDIVRRNYDPCTGEFTESISPDSAPGPSANGPAPGDENAMTLTGELNEGTAAQGHSTQWNLRRVDCDKDLDTDGGGVGDCQEVDQGTDPTNPDDDHEADADGDGVLDVSDNCPSTPNGDQADLDGDGSGDVCDADVDGDGLSNDIETETGLNPRNPDTDGDGHGDGTDNCPRIPNADQADADGDGIGDACEAVACEARHSTVLEAPAKLDVAVAPDPHLATINMQLAWCETKHGPRIMTRPETLTDPYGWWLATDNWVLLGALESFAGLTVAAPKEPTVTHGKVLATVEGSLHLNLDGAQAVLSAVPVGKLFTPLKKVLRKYADDLNPLAKRLKKYKAQVTKASKHMSSTRQSVRKARAEVAEIRRLVAETETALEAATSRAEKKRLTEELENLNNLEQVAKNGERIKSREHQEAISELRAIKVEEAKVARQVDELLRKVRKALDKANNLQKKVNGAIDDAVDNVRPKWAREVVRELVKELKAPLENAMADLEAKIKDLTADKLQDILRSTKATSAILNYLKTTYRKAVRTISTIGVPIWDASMTVGLGPDNDDQPFLVDNSRSRFIFTVKPEPKLSTS